MPRRTRYSQDGRSAAAHAGDVYDVRYRDDGAQRRPVLLLRRVDQRRDSARNRALARVALAILSHVGWRHSHRALHDAANDLRLFRPNTLLFRARARKPTRNDDASDRACALRNFFQRSAYACVALAARISTRRTRALRDRGFGSADAICFAGTR